MVDVWLLNMGMVFLVIVYIVGVNVYIVEFILIDYLLEYKLLGFVLEQWLVYKSVVFNKSMVEIFCFCYCDLVVMNVCVSLGDSFFVYLYLEYNLKQLLVIVEEFWNEKDGENIVVDGLDN